MLILSGCSRAQTVSYYLQHDAERSHRVDQCAVVFDQSADCKNARTAELQTLGIKPGG